MKYSTEAITEAVQKSLSVSEVLRRLGARQDGGTHTHITKRIKNLGLDTTHFTGQHFNRGKQPPNRKTPDQIFVLGTENDPRAKAYQLRRAMLEVGVLYACSICGNTGSHQEKPLALEVDHIDGRFYNNQKENLRFLCPNCHSQCDTNTSWRR